jgi:hypothetical protein
MEQWSRWLQKKTVRIHPYAFNGADEKHRLTDPEMVNMLLPLMLRRDKKVEPIDNLYEAKKKDRVYFLINQQKKEEALAWLNENGWK